MNILERYTKFKQGELSKKVGVYTITNLVNKHIYVGETTNLESRFIEHLRRLTSNRHVNNHLQSSCNKYGIHNFEFEVLEFCEAIDSKKREHYWVTYLHTLDKSIGYNIKPTDPNKINLRSLETSKKIYETKKRKAIERGYWHSKESIEKRKNSRKGYTHSEDTKLKIGKKSLGRSIPKSEVWKANMSIIAKAGNFGGKGKKKIVQLTKTGEILKIWESISETAKYGFSSWRISEICNGKPHCKTHKGYIWKYENM